MFVANHLKEKQYEITLFKRQHILSFIIANFIGIFFRKKDKNIKIRKYNFVGN